VHQEGTWLGTACPEIGTVNPGETQAEAVVHLQATALYREE